MKNIIKRDLKKFGILILIYLVLQYLAVFCIEEVGMLIGRDINFLLEYFYYFLIIIAVIFLVLGSLLLLLYLIIKPAIEDKKEGYSLGEGIVLYRFIGLVALFFIGLFNFFVALALITGFDLKILFEQSLHLYIGLSFGIEAVLSLILIGYNRIYNNKFFSNKLNILLNITILLVIYLAGNLYYFYYFQYGMMLLLVGYIILFLNIKLICKDVFSHTITRVIWSILLIILISLFILSFVKGENLDKESYFSGPNEAGKVYEENITYPYENINSEFGTIRKYTIGKDNIKYVFTYNDKAYEISLYGKGGGSEFYMRNINNVEYIRLYEEGGGFYIDSSILEDSQKEEENYLICNGSYSIQELKDSQCVDADTLEVILYVKDNLQN